MINREVIYDRNLTGSYMKIPVSIGHEFDEKMMLRRKLPGLLPVERCYIDGAGQYWYNISGKQSLDTYCRIQSIGIDFIEKIIVGICSEIEILERNLLDQNCLLLDPEQIFISNQNQEIIFAIYPGHHESVASGFQQLMEYLLTKIDHSDKDAVHAGYVIYEKTLDEAYTIMDIRDEMITRRSMNICDNMNAEREPEPETECKEKMMIQEESSEKISFTDTIRTKVFKAVEKWKENVLNIFSAIKPEKSSKEETPTLVYPDDPEPEEEITIHPTVCLGDYRPHPEGMLMYEGGEGFESLRITDKPVCIGKATDVELQIQKDTISRYHARIDKRGGEYYIEDLNSTNGTYVNDKLLPYKEMRKLSSNDIICFADVKYHFL